MAPSTSMTDAHPDRLGDFLAAYLHMLPPLAVLWLFGRALPGRLEEIGLDIALGVFVVAAAAKAVGVHGSRSTFGLAMERSFTFMMNGFLAVLGLALFTAMGGTLGALLGGLVGLGELPAGIAGALAFTGPLVWTYWPVIALPVVAPRGMGLRGPGNHGPWRGPGLLAAGRLSREAGEAVYTGPIVATFYVWTVLLVFVGEPGTPDWGVRAAELFSYFAAIPLLVWLAVVETERLFAVAGGDLVARSGATWDAVRSPERSAGAQQRPRAPAGALEATAATEGAGHRAEPSPPEAVHSTEGLRDAPSSTFPYDTLEFGGAQRPPFAAGGEGDWFLYFSNRNVCTYLFPARPADGHFWEVVSEMFEQGYSTLYVVEKLWSATPAEAVAVDPDAVPVPERMSHDHEGALGPIVVFRDPGATNVGGSARVSEHAEFHGAVAAARELAVERNVTVLVGREVVSRTWH